VAGDSTKRFACGSSRNGILNQQPAESEAGKLTADGVPMNQAWPCFMPGGGCLSSGPLLLHPQKDLELLESSLSRLQDRHVEGLVGIQDKVTNQVTQWQALDGAVTAMRRELSDVKEQVAAQREDYAQRYEKLEMLLRLLRESLLPLGGSAQPAPAPNTTMGPMY